jgi:hypothetical protein
MDSLSFQAGLRLCLCSFRIELVSVLLDDIGVRGLISWRYGYSYWHVACCSCPEILAIRLASRLLGLTDPVIPSQGSEVAIDVI